MMSMAKFLCVNVIASVLATSATVTSLAEEATEFVPSSKSTTVFIGGETGEIGQVGFAGFFTAFNGDINSDGFLFRVSSTYADIDYTSAGTTFNSEGLSADIMLGYQTVRDNYRAAIFAGFDHQDNDISPLDPNNSTEGGEAGFKVQGEMTANSETGFINLIASYSTANETYFTLGRLGINIGNGLAIGPEGAFLGNVEFDGTKVGGFVSGIQFGDLNLSLNGGYQESGGIGDNNGAYGGATVSFQF